MASIFETYYNWLFDGHPKSKIPEEVVKSGSPINHRYVISVFLTNGNLNHYLNSYFNNINIWYLDLEELLLFIKKCIKDFRISRKTLVYTPWKKTDKLYEELRKKIPILKDHELSFLCEMIEKSEERDVMYASLGLDKIDKKDMKTNKQKKSKDKIKADEFIYNNFKLVEVKDKEKNE